MSIALINIVSKLPIQCQRLKITIMSYGSSRNPRTGLSVEVG